MLDAARSGSAVIRDTDGLSLTLMPTEVVQRDNYVCEGLRAALVMLLLLRAPLPASPSHYGRLGWLAVLPAPDQEEFIWEYINALLMLTGQDASSVERLVYEWQQTARAWADPALRAQLSAGLHQPLPQVEL